MKFSEWLLLFHVKILLNTFIIPLRHKHLFLSKLFSKFRKLLTQQNEIISFKISISTFFKLLTLTALKTYSI